eukprot:6187095-Pleurochrysis_carterae.AAC.2
MRVARAREARARTMLGYSGMRNGTARRPTRCVARVVPVRERVRVRRVRRSPLLEPQRLIREHFINGGGEPAPADAVALSHARGESRALPLQRRAVLWREEDEPHAVEGHVLRALHRDGAEDTRERADQLAPHRLGGGEEAEVGPADGEHHDERVEELVVVRRADEDARRTFVRHLELVARVHLSKKDLDGGVEHREHQLLERDVEHDPCRDEHRRDRERLERRHVERRQARHRRQRQPEQPAVKVARVATRVPVFLAREQALDLGRRLTRVAQHRHKRSAAATIGADQDWAEARRFRRVHTRSESGRRLRVPKLTRGSSTQTVDTAGPVRLHPFPPAKHLSGEPVR